MASGPLRIDHPVAGSAGSTPRVLSAVQLESRQTARCHGTFLSRRQLIGGWPGGRRAVANRPALGVGNESRSRPWGSCYSAPMKAAVHTRYGPPEVVQISEVKKPAAEDNELLIKVHATTVNRTDCGFRSGKPFFSRFFTGPVGPKGDGHGARVCGKSRGGRQ